MRVTAMNRRMGCLNEAEAFQSAQSHTSTAMVRLLSISLLLLISVAVQSAPGLDEYVIDSWKTEQGLQDNMIN